MKILIIGESCLDVYQYGDSRRLCPEAPVPVFNSNNFKNTNEIDIIYPGVGENYDFITEFKNLHHKKIFILVKENLAN